MKKVGLILLGILMAVGVSAEVKKIKGTGYLVVHDRQISRLPVFPFNSRSPCMYHKEKRKGLPWRRMIILFLI